MDPEQRSTQNQVVGYLRGRATAIEEEGANAPEEALPGIRERAAAYHIAADYLDEEANE